ncbi:MAG: carboxypeptidase-like regulatory domain-containing protein [Bacteroidota bacterium]
MVRIIAFFCCLLLVESLSAQTFSGLVVDAETGLGIPFVNIGIPELGLGTVSNKNGEYRLTVKGENCVILFSSIGYQKKEVSAADLAKNSLVRMHPKVELLDEVVVEASRYGEGVVLGYKLDNKGHSIGFGSRQLGTEIGAHIKVKKEAVLKSAHFTVNFTGADSLLFRVNVYDFAKEELGEKLTPRDIIIRAPQKKGTFDVDLESYDIWVKEDVLLTLEWVQDDEGKGNEGLMFRSKKGSGTNLYTKRTSFAEFKKLSDEVSVAPKLKIGFYLIAVQKSH